MAARSAVVQRGRVGDRVGGEHAEHRGQAGGEHAGALGHAADRPAVAGDARSSSGRVSVVMMACGRGRARRRGPGRARRRRPRRAASAIGSRSPISPVEQTATSAAPTTSRPPPLAVSRAAASSAVAWVSWKPCGPVQAFAPPELSTTARTMPASQHLLAPQHRRGLDPVGGEDAGGGGVGAVVDDQGDVEAAGRLQPGGDAAGPETLRRGHAHDAPPRGCTSRSW